MIQYIDKHASSNQLNLKELSWKTTTLFALTNADRASDLNLLDLKFRICTEEGVSLQIPGLTKMRRSGPLRVLTYMKFPDNQNVCPVATLMEYEKPIKDLRKADLDRDPLFIGITKPHKPVTSFTISRWLKNMMAYARIDVHVAEFTAHSTRAAATSAAAKAGVLIKNIVNTACQLE